ncbi:hypothetical protein KCP91_08190 [Microvirga sp. SRT01]|uniref:Uncharacterized protein n=1 Tax=Sphingomonas longa TaxID=2778730 RepID=A0ABS2D5Z9_9SPHN|nr:MULTISPECIES: hypothetical protein [Alphaproteobacteria]MBM6576350.1 hypothetical protein [Sphingomonas sp. BT552]MBR7709396.1 hypothetical protein [Microvirga sp. SRT01]
MIEFIQDYVTKSLPPETFKDGEKVERSPESELYLVQLGVAGYVHDGRLVDQDYQPLVRKPAVVVVTSDRRLADTGRAGEMLGLDAPQRATSGPGNAVVFSGQPDSTTLGGTEFEQLRSDFAAVHSQFEQYRTGSTEEMDRLKGLIDAGNDAFREMNNSHVEDKERLTSERDEAIRERNEAKSYADDLGARITQLEADLAAATAPPPPDDSALTAAPAQRRGK